MIMAFSRSLALSAVFALAGLLTAPASAQSASGAALPRPAIGTPKPFSLPKSKSFTLENGLTTTLIPYGVAPKATIVATIAVGNLNDGDDTWLADTVGAMLQEGAGGRSASEIADRVAAMGGTLSITVTGHETIVSLSVLEDRAPDAITLISQVIRQPNMPAHDLPRVRDSLVGDVDIALSQPQPVAEEALAAAVYGDDHPYGRVFPSPEQLRSYSIGKVMRFYNEQYGAARTRIYVAGRFDARKTAKAIRIGFEDWEAGPLPLARPPAPDHSAKLILVDRPGAAQSTVRLAFPAPAAGAAGDLNVRVMNTLLGGSFTSRLVQNLREDKGYAYSPGSSVYRNSGESLWVFHADVTTDDTGAALSETLAEIERLKTEAIPAEEAQGVRNYLAGLFVLANASTYGLIGQVADRDFHTLPADWLDTYVPAVLDVSADEIAEAARAWLAPDTMTLVVVGDMARVKPQLAQLSALDDIPRSEH